MDFRAETEKRKDGHLNNIGGLAYEYFQLCRQVELNQKRIAEIDTLIAEQEARIAEDDQALRNFGTYLAVKENAVTLDQLKDGIEKAQE